ncbi:hypothetical protein HHI36_000612 [Cryptolaemus montrouzieri]|uniref:Uncharacterized protein n=1 Tax=Cryptolaemus montrouzieri TaxID=559131 RepID=A0ABD2P506_9CUCU
MAEKELYLWYFDNLLFLVDGETPRESFSSLDNPIKNTSNRRYSFLMTLMSPPLFAEETDEESASVIASTSRSAPSSSITASSSKSRTERTRDKADELSAHHFVSVLKTLDNKDDEFEIIGKNYGNKLREMPFCKRRNQLD